MFSEKDVNDISNFLKKEDCPWFWIDITTTMGPTKLEEYFKGLIGGDTLNHWSPSTPEGYLEISGNEKNVVIHWIIGENDKLVNFTCVECVDFDEIDKSLASTIIHNSVIRIMSEKF